MHIFYYFPLTLMSSYIPYLSAVIICEQALQIREEHRSLHNSKESLNIFLIFHKPVTLKANNFLKISYFPAAIFT